MVTKKAVFIMIVSLFLKKNITVDAPFSLARG